MDAGIRGQDAAVTRAHDRPPLRRRLLTGGAMLAAALGLAALLLAAWPVPTADAAKIICVWDAEQKKWVCWEEGSIGAVTPARDAVASRIICVRDDNQKKRVCFEEGRTGGVGA